MTETTGGMINVAKIPAERSQSHGETNAETMIDPQGGSGMQTAIIQEKETGNQGTETFPHGGTTTETVTRVVGVSSRAEVAETGTRTIINETNTIIEITTSGAVTLITREIIEMEMAVIHKVTDLIVEEIRIGISMVDNVIETSEVILVEASATTENSIVMEVTGTSETTRVGSEILGKIEIEEALTRTVLDLEPIRTSNSRLEDESCHQDSRRNSNNSRAHLQTPCFHQRSTPPYQMIFSIPSPTSPHLPVSLPVLLHKDSAIHSSSILLTLATIHPATHPQEAHP